MVISSIYVFAFCGMFATSAFVDSYWLIPVFPYFVFFGVVLIVFIAFAELEITAVLEAEVFATGRNDRVVA